METRLYNIFKITTVKKLSEAIVQSPFKVLIDQLPFSILQCSTLFKGCLSFLLLLTFRLT